MEKKSEPASATAINASPAAEAAWVRAKWAKGEVTNLPAPVGPFRGRCGLPSGCQPSDPEFTSPIVECRWDRFGRDFWISRSGNVREPVFRLFGRGIGAQVPQCDIGPLARWQGVSRF